MNEHEIKPPPFPTPLCTPIAIHHQLQRLDEWVDSVGDWANEEARQFESPEDPFVPATPTVPQEAISLMAVAIPSLARTWMTMRAIRERWDWIARNYEEDWESEKSIFSRIMCVKTAALVLVNAYLDPEKYEAKQQDPRQNDQQQILEVLRRSGIPENILRSMGIESNGEEQEIDFDRLFHPDEEDG